MAEPQRCATRRRASAISHQQPVVVWSQPPGMKDLDGKGPILRANSAPSGSRSGPAAATNAQHRLDDYIRSRESTALVGENATFLHSFA
ncbi:hypothetical protein CKAH01_04531 [Colletotrichum kahawae]|uniref:Uncharacterized protein n=1 Tax=Colletotrichum kahawae TaxID=34407 RepID=A0AAD9YL88_COLKA|nr:hypothetical protein CKAH01_04531 [Colletotrichum kahawae]